MSTEQEVSVSQKETDVENKDIVEKAAAELVDINEEKDTEEAVSAATEKEVTVEELQKQLEEAQQQAKQNWDRALRVQAEMENLKRRTEKDLENAHKFALEKFAKELLVVLDSLELGIQAATSDNPDVVKLREGSELTIKQFESVFAKFNIEKIDPLGQPFNPEQHQAMSMQPSAEYAPNTVMAVFQKGYMLNGRLLRPAMVVVAKAIEDAPKNTPQIDEQA
jgi:molecular chaperone GrpE